MIRAGALIAALFALGACGEPSAPDDPAGFSDTRQQPSNLTPGVHLSGHVNVGIVKNF